MGLARYGLRELFAAALVLGSAGAGLWLFVHPAAVAGPGALFLFCLWFFRDPERVSPPGDDLILAPADGRVTDIEEVDEPEFIRGRALRVGIFLSIFDVHVNRSPLAARVGLVSYKRGRFLAAFDPRASRENESNLVGLEVGSGAGEPLRLAVKQIAGIIARRIVCTCRQAQALARGERFGMIKFGSRTELYLPKGAPVELTVRVGDRVRAGLTVMGRLVREGGPP